MEIWWLILEDEMAHSWRLDGSFLEMRWLILGDEMAHSWRCGASLVEHQTSGTEVLSSNTASPAMILHGALQDHCEIR